MEQGTQTYQTRQRERGHARHGFSPTRSCILSEKKLVQKRYAIVPGVVYHMSGSSAQKPELDGHAKTKLEKPFFSLKNQITSSSGEKTTVPRVKVAQLASTKMKLLFLL